MASVSSVVVFLFLTTSLFQYGICMNSNCQNLKTGDVSTFDIRKYEGNHEFVMAVLGAGPLQRSTLNCNKVSILLHDHLNGGVNAAFLLYAGNDRSVLASTYSVHLNSSTDIYMTEIGRYHSNIGKWVDTYCKILLATDDLFVYSLCLVYDNEVHSLAVVLRREGSKLSLCQVRSRLPESIRNHPGLTPLCYEADDV